jgi:SSS family solute:Na+ symporter
MTAGAELTAVDIAVVAAYFVAVLSHGLWVGRGERTALDYFLAGRTLPWALIGFSLYASNMSGASFVGLMGASYAHGMVVFNYEWTAALVLIFFALFMAPVFLRTGLYTVPEYLERRFDARSRYAYAGFTVLTIMFIDTAGALYAGGIVITTAIPTLDLWQASAALALLAGVYTVFGGLKAVVVTDTLQALVMIVGAAVICVVGLDAVGGWDALFRGLDETQARLIMPAADGFLPWPGIGGVIILGFYYWTLNQYFVQRALAARTLDDARRGALFGGLLKLPNVFLMIIPGLIAIRLFPGLDSPDRVFPALAFELLPAGLRGLILTALVAAIMSSLDSALNAAASLVTMDFVRQLRPATSARSLLVIGRWVTAVAMVVAALYAPLIRDFGSLFQYFQSTLAYLVPPIVAVYLVGIFWRRATATGAFSALVSGLALGLALFVLKEVTGTWSVLGLPAIHFTYMAMLMCAFTAVVTAAVSLAGPAPATVDAVIFRRADLGTGSAGEGPLPWYRDHRWQAAGLGLLMTAAIAAFW